MRLARILDGQIMQAELRLHPLQELRAGLVEANPDDVARALRPLARFLDGDIFNPASTTVDARRNHAGFGARRIHRYFLSSRIHVSHSVLNQ